MKDKSFISTLNKTDLFEYLDKLRKDNPKKYSELLKKHEDDLFEIGYLKSDINT